jgi:hypothetical protein
MVLGAVLSLLLAVALVWPREDWRGPAGSSLIGAGRADPLESEIATLRAYQGMARRKLRALQLRDSVIAAGTGRVARDSMLRMVVSGPSASEADIRTYTRRLTDELRAVANNGPRSPVAVFVNIETAQLKPATDSTQPRRLGWELVYSTPAPGSNEPCVTMLYIVRDPARTASGESRTEAPGNHLLGPCAFYAAFGHPGIGISSWLKARDYDVADYLDPARPWAVGPFDNPYRQTRAHPVYLLSRQRLLNLGSVGGVAEDFPFDAELAFVLQRCLDGDTSACEALALTPGLRVPYAIRATGSDNGVPLQIRIPSSQPIEQLINIHTVPFDVTLMNGLLNEILAKEGRERFARFWRSSAPAAEAFSQVTGQRLGEWVHEHLPYYARRGSAVKALTIGIALAYILGSLGLALRTGTRREVR